MIEIVGIDTAPLLAQIALDRIQERDLDKYRAWRESSEPIELLKELAMAVLEIDSGRKT